LILIVDDHDMVRNALAEGLQMFGHEVDQAESGAKALAAIDARPPDVLVTDLEMPGMSGAQLIQTARSAYPALPIVAMTGGAPVKFDRTETLEKPFKSSELLRAIEHAFACAPR